jgi:hypothetical protein
MAPVCIRTSELMLVSSASFLPNEVAHLDQSEIDQIRYIARREYRIEELQSPLSICSCVAPLGATPGICRMTSNPVPLGCAAIAQPTIGSTVVISSAMVRLPWLSLTSMIVCEAVASYEIKGKG